jgi:hypothetical protein
MSRTGRIARAIPLADVETLGPLSRRLAAIRIGLAAGLCLCLGFAIVAARRLDESEPPLLASTSAHAVVALDVSTSIDLPKFRDVARALRRIAETRRTAGLVLFSNDAYDALPAGTPAAELRSYERFFALRRTDQIFTPWIQFSGGTRIARGLDGARAALARTGVRGGTVLLISDLLDTDLRAIEEAVFAYRRAGITLRVLALGRGQVRETLERLVGPAAFVTEAELGRETASSGGDAGAARFPLALALAGALLLVLLGLSEHWCARLVWKAASTGGAR